MTTSAQVMLCALLATTAAEAQTQQPWIEARAGYLRVVSDGNELAVRELLHQIQYVQSLVERGTGLRIDDPAEPLIVLAPHHKAGMRDIVGDAYKKNRGLLVAAALPSPYSNHFAVRLDARQARQLQLLLHEYLHVITKATLGEAPAWLDEGLSEYWSTLEVRDGVVRVGRAQARYVQTLRHGRWIPLADLVKVPRGRYDKIKGGLASFYAQSWALVHYLQSKQLAANATYEVSLPDDLESLDVSLRQYVRGEFHVVTLPPRRIERASDQISVHAMRESDALALRASVLVFGDRPQRAAELALRALRLYAAHPLALEVMGLSHFFANEPAQARDWLQKAVQNREAGYRAHYYYGVLLSDTPDIADQHLSKALELRPNFAPARVRLRH